MPRERDGEIGQEPDRFAAGGGQQAAVILRDGDARLEQISDTRRATLHAFIARTVKDEAEAIYTDELASYLGIADDDTRHATVNHSMGQWVLGDVHTNSIESIWALFKRSLMGAFHHVSPKHLDRYLEELEWLAFGILAAFVVFVTSATIVEAVHRRKRTGS